MLTRIWSAQHTHAGQNRQQAALFFDLRAWIIFFAEYDSRYESVSGCKSKTEHPSTQSTQQNGWRTGNTIQTNFFQ